MNINSRNIYIVYVFLYFSLLVGFYFNEDFALGYKTDYLRYKDFVPLSHMALDYAAQGKTSLDEVFKVAELVPEVVNH